jgi:inhibitor of KinA
MKLEPLGEAAFIIRGLGGSAADIARRLNEQPTEGVLEATACYETVGLYVDPDRFQPDQFNVDLGSLAHSYSTRRHRIPVCYEMGEDLDDAAHQLGLTPEELIQEHSRAVYRCYAIGFSPGFPYLGYLPKRICGVARKAVPRVRVPAGSVGITGDQTGIYPASTPGGWCLIGRTPLQLVSVQDGYYPIEAGDEVVFVPIPASEFAGLEGRRLEP